MQKIFETGRRINGYWKPTLQWEPRFRRRRRTMFWMMWSMAPLKTISQEASLAITSAKSWWLCLF